MIVALASAAPLALAQAEKEPEKRGSIPIGTSQDGSGPSDGALIGGSADRIEDVRRAPQRAISRCKELSGVLQEECLQDLELSTASGSRPVDAFPTPATNEIYADPRKRRR